MTIAIAIAGVVVAVLGAVGAILGFLAKYIFDKKHKLVSKIDEINKWINYLEGLLSNVEDIKQKEFIQTKINDLKEEKELVLLKK